MFTAALVRENGIAYSRSWLMFVSVAVRRVSMSDTAATTTNSCTPPTWSVDRTCIVAPMATTMPLLLERLEAGQFGPHARTRRG